MADLEFIGVSKVFAGGVQAVKGLEVLIRDGELVVLVGPSGSGKTTALRLMAGLEQPTSGQIRIGGRDVTHLAPRKRDLAMVFQDLGLYGHLTARENMAFGLRLRQGGWWSGRRDRLSSAEIEERVRRAASRLGIDSLLARKPAELSGGQQQRVALGRAIMRQPAAMLLDEPLASLDLPLRRALRQELRGLQQELNLTMVYVTHDQSEAMALADRIVVLNEGSVEQVGTAQEIYLRPATQLVAGFFGSQGMNYETDNEQGVGMTGRLAALAGGASGEPPREAVTGRDAAVTGPVTVGFRPEDALLLAERPAGQAAMAVNILESEYQGDACYVTVSPAGDGRRKWIVRTSGDGNSPAAGERYLAIRPGGLHWFDRDGKRFA